MIIKRRTWPAVILETDNLLILFQPLDAAMSKEVEAVLTTFLKKGEKSFVKYHINPALIGGMIVAIGDKYVDMSMSSKLNKYTDIIKSAA